MQADTIALQAFDPMEAEILHAGHGLLMHVRWPFAYA